MISKNSFLLLLCISSAYLSLASQKSGHPKPPRAEETAAKKQKTGGAQFSAAPVSIPTITAATTSSIASSVPATATTSTSSVAAPVTSAIPAASSPGFGDPALNAIFYAIDAGDVSRVHALLSQPNKIDINGFPKLLPLPGGDYTLGQGTPLMLAASRGDIQIVQMLIRAGADLNKQDKDGFTALMYAIIRENTPIVTELIKSRADLNKKTHRGNNALHCALIGNKLASAQVLIQAGIDVNNCNKDGKTALMIAVEKGLTVTVTSLLQRGANPNLQDIHGSTALSFAAEKGYSAIVASLLKHGANPNLQNIHGSTALTFAAEKGYAAIVAPLLQHNANPNLQDKRGNSALMYAAYYGKNKIIDLLNYAKVEVDPNLQTFNGETALFHAIGKNRIKAVKALLLAHRNNRFTIDFSKATKTGDRALDYAVKSNPLALKLLLAEPDVVSGQIPTLITSGKLLAWHHRADALISKHVKVLDHKLFGVIDQFYFIIEQGSVNDIKIYLKKAKDLRIYDMAWRNPLHKAFLTRILLLTQKNKNKAQLKKNSEIIGLLLAYNPHLLWEEDAQGVKPITLAAQDPELMRLLVKLAYAQEPHALNVSHRYSLSFARQPTWQTSSTTSAIPSPLFTGSSVVNSRPFEHASIASTSSITANYRAQNANNAHNVNTMLLSANGHYAAAATDDEPLVSAHGRYGTATTSTIGVSSTSHAALADITARAAVLAQQQANANEPASSTEPELDASIFIVDDESSGSSSTSATAHGTK